jgi:hypothetical protein
VAEEWLADQEFVELRLSPMSPADVQSFVGRWHTAARTNSSEEDEALASYETQLLHAIRTKPDLGRIATNPLMCGLICALHRDRHGFLPIGRKELYQAAFSMLLTRRDRERGVTGAELREEPQLQILQRLAYWLIKDGRTEMTRDRALTEIGKALPALPEMADWVRIQPPPTLPGPEELVGAWPASDSDEYAQLCVRTASLIGTDEAIPYLARFRNHPSQRVRGQLALFWHRFGIETYGREVIAHLPYDDLYLIAHSVVELRALRELGGRPWIRLVGDFTARSLLVYLDPGQLARLDLRGTVDDMSVLFSSRSPSALRTPRWRVCGSCPSCISWGCRHGTPPTPPNRVCVSLRSAVSTSTTRKPKLCWSRSRRPSPRSKPCVCPAARAQATAWTAPAFAPFSPTRR